MKGHLLLGAFVDHSGKEAHRCCDEDHEDEKIFCHWISPVKTSRPATLPPTNRALSGAFCGGKPTLDKRDAWSG